MYLERLARLRALIQETDLHAVALTPGPTMRYLTGLEFHLSERPIVALIHAEGHGSLMIPELERSKAEGAELEFERFVYGENERFQVVALEQALAAAGLSTGRVGVEPTKMRFLEVQLLQQAAPTIEVISAEPLLATFRMTKGEDEVDALRRAVKVAECALERTLPHIRAGMTERELAAELTLQVLQAGSEPDLPFSPIVASGPNSALPHATPSDRRLQAGDLLILDWGARVEGYVSDLTRTFALGELDPELTQVHELVQQANAAGRAAVRPGVPGRAVDRAAREVIQGAGYGGYFIHRTGHGIGLEAHEPPSIHGDNPQLLVEGMVFTVEPGVYLPERGGVRVEDNVVITADSGESLSTYPRSLEFVG